MTSIDDMINLLKSAKEDCIEIKRMLNDLKKKSVEKISVNHQIGLECYISPFKINNVLSKNYFVFRMPESGNYQIKNCIESQLK